MAQSTPPKAPSEPAFIALLAHVISKFETEAHTSLKITAYEPWRASLQDLKLDGAEVHCGVLTQADVRCTADDFVPTWIDLHPVTIDFNFGPCVPAKCGVRTATISGSRESISVVGVGKELVGFHGKRVDINAVDVTLGNTLIFEFQCVARATLDLNRRSWRSDRCLNPLLGVAGSRCDGRNAKLNPAHHTLRDRCDSLSEQVQGVVVSKGPDASNDCTFVELHRPITLLRFGRRS